MKTTSTKKNIELAKRLLVLTEKLKELEKEQKEIKEHFKGIIKSGSLGVGDITITVSEQTRAWIDREALILDQGIKFVSKYEKMTTYDVVRTVKGK